MQAGRLQLSISTRDPAYEFTRLATRTGHLMISIKNRAFSRKLILEFCKFAEQHLSRAWLTVVDKPYLHNAAIFEDDPALREIAGRHSVDKQQLDGLYFRLRAAGAGRWVRGHYVAASVFLFGTTLDYLLANQSSFDFAAIAERLVDYFRKGEVGRVT